MTEFLAEFGLRDWLLVLGPLFIVVILVHGYWRMRVNRSSLKMALDKSFVSDISDAEDEGDELSLLRAELPNGGARVLSPTEQTSLNLDDDVPVLMNPVNEDESSRAATVSVDIDTNTSEVSTPDEGHEETRDEPSVTPVQARTLPDDLPEKYVVINVMSIADPFSGQQLLECLLELEMSLGEMDIFHRMQGQQTMFSLMNAVEPGSFDMATIDKIETPAVSMFMRVHELLEPRQVFEQMVEVAENIAEELGGEVRDESRSVMTTQTIEHCRQELDEYVFKHHTLST